MQEKHVRHTFTLIELLVVISIIAILASMLLPSLQKAREKATQTTCLGNMRQIGIGCQMYVMDSEGWYPGAFVYLPMGTSGAASDSLWWWFDFTFPYVGDLEPYLCPIAPRPVWSYTFKRPTGWPNPFRGSYAVPIVPVSIAGTSVRPYGYFYLRESPIGTPVWYSPHVSRYPDPSGTIWLADSKNAEMRAGTGTYAEMFAGVSRLSVDRKHLGGANYTFCDGRASWYYNPHPGMWTSTPND